MTDELRVDARLADAARDELAVLAAEVDDEDRDAPPAGLRASGAGRPRHVTAGSSARPS
jgi:hypothetical protein